jgi:hypothetical protein
MVAGRLQVRAAGWEHFAPEQLPGGGLRRPELCFAVDQRTLACLLVQHFLMSVGRWLRPVATVMNVRQLQGHGLSLRNDVDWRVAVNHATLGNDRSAPVGLTHCRTFAVLFGFPASDTHSGSGVG